MNPTQHSQNREEPGRRAETAATMASPGPASVAPVDKRQLENAVSWTGTRLAAPCMCSITTCVCSVGIRSA